MHYVRPRYRRILIGLILALLAGLLPLNPGLALPPLAISTDDTPSQPTPRLARNRAPITNPAPATVTPLASTTSSVTLDVTMTADPTVVHQGDAVTYTLQLAAQADPSVGSGQALAGVTVTDRLPDGAVYVPVTDRLPDGAVYVPGTASAGQYDPPSRQIIWDVPALSAGQAAQLTFRARMTGPPGREVLNRAMATVAGSQYPRVATVAVQVLHPIVDTVITPGQGGVLTSADGRIELRFPPHAVERAVIVHHVPRLPQHGARLTFDLTAERQSDDQPITRFNQPVTITVSYTAEDEAWLRARSVVRPLSPRLWYLDPEQQQRVPVAGTLDPAERTFIATLDHFSTYQFGETNFEPDVLPTVEGAGTVPYQCG